VKKNVSAKKYDEIRSFDGIFATGVVDTGGKFAIGIIDTGGKFAISVVDTSGAP
jgi:hypothetical protein